jgi:TolA-binding protein
MATTETEAAYRTLSIGEHALESDDDRVFVQLRRELDIGAFGVGAIYQAKAGDSVINEHDEAGPGSDGHEELYVVLQGGATFTVDGAELDAPHGTAVFVRDPATKRKAVATSDGTIVLAVGGRRGEAYRLSPAMSAQGFYKAYQAGDYETAMDACRRGLEAYPGNAYLLYNVACLDALSGRADEALSNLERSVDAWPAYKELAREDDDFASLRADARFKALIG